MAEKKLPARQELLDALKKLQDVSEKNEKLTKELAKGKDLPPKVRQEVEACINEQSKLVDYFIQLSEDEEAKQNYYKLVKEIETPIGKLEKAEKMEELESLKGKVGETIQHWVIALEQIVSGVFSRTGE